MELKEIKKLEDYLIKKDRAYAVYGLTRNDVKTEFLLSDNDVERYLKRKFVYTVGEAIQLLIKINKNERESKK